MAICQVQINFKVAKRRYIKCDIFSGDLIITNSQEQDEGKYECMAVNDAGVAFSYNANLYVRGK